MYNADGEFVRRVNEEKSDEELAEILSAYPAKKYPWWRVVLVVLTVVAVVVMVGAIVDYWGTRAKLVETMMNPMSMFFDEDTFENEAELKFKTEPTHKGYFMQYVLTNLDSDELGIEEMLKLADEVDPENALYLYLAAGKDDREIVKKQYASSSGLSDEERFKRTTEYEVLDNERYKKALNYIVEAGKYGKIVDHSLEVRLEKLSEARENHPQDYLGRFASFRTMHEVRFYSMNMLNVTTILDAKFYELSKDGTEEEVLFWKGEYLKLLDKMLENDGVLIDLLVMKAALKSVLANMQAAADRVGMDGEVEKITEFSDMLYREREAQKNVRKLRRDEWKNRTEFSEESYLNELSYAPMLSHLPSNVQLEVNIDPAPGRLVEHALLGRILVTLSFVLIGVFCLGMWIYYGNKSKEMRVMSNQVLGSLSWLDGVLVVLGGVVFPVVGYVLINEQTGLGVREWSVGSVAGLLVLLQFCGMLLTVFSLSSVLLRWRLSKSLPEIVKSCAWYRWFIPCTAFVAMILVGFSDSKEEMLPWVVSLMLLSISLLAWVGVSIGQCFFKSEKLVKLTLCRGLLSLYAAALILMVGLSFYYHAQEFKYVAEDESFSMKEEHLGVSVLEYRVVEKMRESLRERLEIIR